jgi:hypothetical protein
MAAMRWWATRTSSLVGKRANCSDALASNAWARRFAPLPTLRLLNPIPRTVKPCCNYLDRRRRHAGAGADHAHRQSEDREALGLVIPGKLLATAGEVIE